VRNSIVYLGLCIIWILEGILFLDRWPSLWWDEGWTMNVARNWVDFGHYGQMNAGQPAPPGLSAAFPVVMPVALSFKLFGVGTWQARLPGVLFLLASIGLLYYQALRLYNRRAAWAVPLVLLLMSGIGQLHPLPVGRAVLGEMPMLFYLLAGWTCLLGVLSGRTWLLLPAVLMWGLGIDAKSQALPFWLASLILPLAVAVWKGWRREALLLAAGLGGGWQAGRCCRCTGSWWKLPLLTASSRGCTPQPPWSWMQASARTRCGSCSPWGCPCWWASSRLPGSLTAQSARRVRLIQGSYCA